MEDQLLRFRERFPILQKKTYLAAHSMGPLSVDVYSALKQYADEWNDSGIDVWQAKWVQRIYENSNLLGKIINAPEGSVILHPNVTTCMEIILSCFDFSDRKKIVSSSISFTSQLYLMKEHERIGARLDLVVPENPAFLKIEEYLDKIDENTAVVFIDLVLFQSGQLQDVSPVIKKCRDVGANVLVDGYQGVGVVPVDVQKMDPDFFVGGSHKWLCGGPGACYLYVKPQLLKELSPRFCGWFSHSNPFAFEQPPVKFAADMFRYMPATPPVPAFYAARAGHEIILEAGVENIRAKSLRQTKIIIEKAKELGCGVITPEGDNCRGGMVCFRCDNLEQVHKALSAKGFVFDARPQAGIRVSPHFYTTDEEIERFFMELKRSIA